MYHIGIYIYIGYTVHISNIHIIYMASQEACTLLVQPLYYSRIFQKKSHHICISTSYVIEYIVLQLKKTHTPTHKRKSLSSSC